MITLEHLRVEINQKYAQNQSWQKTCESYGINKAMARMIALGYQPGKKIRKVLDLPEIAQVIALAGSVPNGTQVIMASRCECGQYFVSNHPRRQKCFICSPYRKRKG